MNSLSEFPEIRTASVLFVDQSGELGGAELSLFDIASAWKAKSRVILLDDGPFRQRLDDVGVRVDVIRLGKAADVGREGRLTSIITAVPSIMGAVWRLAKAARAHQLVYANTQKAFVVSALAALLARRPLIWHLRDILAADHFSTILRRTVVFLANWFADCVIANSHATAEAFLAAGGKCPVRVVHNGIDSNPFDKRDKAEAKQKLRAELGVDKEVIVGVFSRLAHWKGQHVLVEALRELPRVHAVFVGGALFGESQYEAWLRQLIGEVRMADRCHFLGFRKDIPTLMCGVDIVVHTSITPEPFGRVVVEGMLSGNPVIATNAGGVAEIIEEGETGLLVEPGNVDALRQAIHELVSKPANALALAERGGQSVRRSFSLDACLAGVDASIKKVLS